jgi:hypothetical protein
MTCAHHLGQLNRRFANLVPNANSKLYGSINQELKDERQRPGKLTHFLQHLYLVTKTINGLVVLPLEIIGVTVPVR